MTRLDGEIYDEAMDSLTQSERNELLNQVSRQRADAKATVINAKARQDRKPGFWIATFLLLRMILKGILLVVGFILQLLGTLYLTVGTALKKWGESL